MTRRSQFSAATPILAALAMISGLSAPAAAGPGDQIGSATLVENLVTASYARDTRSLQEGDGVRQNERISVGLDARSELQFDDETRLALGPGSELELDKFVYDSDKATGNIMMEMMQGTMRWVTGVAKKPTYTIRVPNASITVRGTIFDVYITKQRETWLLLHEGAVQVCSSRGVCRVHSDPCRIMRVSEGGDVSGPVRWSSLPATRDDTFDRAFPFVDVPPGIDPQPQCSRERITGGRDAGAPPPSNGSRRAEAERSYETTHAVDEDEAKPTRREKPAPRYVPKEPREELSYVKPKHEAKFVPAPVKPRYEAPRKSTKYDASKRSKVVYADPKPRIKYPRRERYASRDDDDDDDDYRPRKRRDRDDDDRPRRRRGSGVGKAILGAAVIGGAIALGAAAMRFRGGGGYGY